VYRDWRDRISYRIIWPQYRTIVYYSHGPWHTYSCVYPYYLRKYVFVGIGGYWPTHYSYTRYHWYGCHPHSWYGYYPIAREVAGDTYNYYTYNYYTDTSEAAATSAQVATGITPVDHNTFADVRAKLAEQAAKEPASPTLADKYFEEAVKAFESGDYATALLKFASARQNAPDDMILPFAHAQALFAMGRYPEAAEVLRAAIEKIDPEKEGVFYPRGLYAKEETLLDQIEKLLSIAEQDPANGDLNLLLGYHLLGLGKTNEAIGPLEAAAEDVKNAKSANALLELARKVQADTAAEKAEIAIEAQGENN
jgi:tetratricopeptide (TPR) repeat protein